MKRVANCLHVSAERRINGNPSTAPPKSGGRSWRWPPFVRPLFATWATLLFASAAAAQDARSESAWQPSRWPSWDTWQRLLLLEDYNTRVVLFGVAMLGAAAGVVGGFTLLRRRALMGDALAHASLPGIALAYIFAVVIGGNEKSIPLLLVGATVSGLLGVGVIILVRRYTPLKEDTALGIVLSVFFGAGAALLGVIQNMGTGHAAGLETFIYGKTASMRVADAQLIAVSSVLVIVACAVLYKEFKLLCFDPDFAGARGLPVVLLDLLLMCLVVITTMVGLQAVGLILMVALLVIPAAAARFWTESLWVLSLIAAAIGTLGSVIGAGSSALLPRLPSGAMIVLVCSALFLISMLFGSRRGVVQRLIRRRRLNRRIARDHLLRGLYELSERAAAGGAESSNSIATRPVAGREGNSDPRPWIPIETLSRLRSWNVSRLRRIIRAAGQDGLLRVRGGQIRLTQAGYVEAARLTRQHRLWELYLLEHADVAPARVDRDADAIEHVLDPEIVDELEQLLDQQPVSLAVPSNPHRDQGA